jgi:hypothetical protein
MSRPIWQILLEMHDEHCPNCREHHLLRIQELEERWSH